LFVTGSGRLYPDASLFATSDGGRTWHLVGQPPAGLQACAPEFSSTTSGSLGACGDPNAGGQTISLDVTTDGGRTWSVDQLPSPPGGCGCSAPIDLQFSDSSTGAFITNAYHGWFLYITTDGGATWHPRAQFAGGEIWAFGLQDRTHLWALASEPSSFPKGAPIGLYLSADEGLHWALVEKNMPVGQVYAKIQFVDAAHGFIVVEPYPTGSAAAQVYVTGDGGHTWTLIKPEVS
jgi:photosystem II stability/assembly factor-like uncharacterized protein